MPFGDFSFPFLGFFMHINTKFCTRLPKLSSPLWKTNASWFPLEFFFLWAGVDCSRVLSRSWSHVVVSYRFAGAGEQSGHAAVKHRGWAQLPVWLHPIYSPSLCVAEEWTENQPGHSALQGQSSAGGQALLCYSRTRGLQFACRVWACRFVSFFLFSDSCFALFLQSS